MCFNNVIKGGTLNIKGSAPSSVYTEYANATLKEAADKAKCTFTVNYESTICSTNVIKQIHQYFDVANNTTCLYVKAGGTGNGKEESTPLGSFAEAYKAMKADGGRLVVLVADGDDNLAKSIRYLETP